MSAIASTDSWVDPVVTTVTRLQDALRVSAVHGARTLVEASIDATHGPDTTSPTHCHKEIIIAGLESHIALLESTIQIQAAERQAIEEASSYSRMMVLKLIAA
ncbi:hypothetical protein BKA62DRAFT_772076 [Auriculariales sp. MPI-PUGE-AT-0066]|nr:hypothetical protein BKA62DRAFT_772076 [Auriculariales sp. MPI-PUGE-AT-0066]